MAPTFCYLCGDAAEEDGDPRDLLAELDSLWERLRLKRYDLKRKINQFHSPIIRKLPPDIISTIFEHCLPDFTDHPLKLYVKETLSLPFSPLSLGAICSYWRDIAWSTPSLWTSLAVHNPSEHDPHRVTGMVREWLGRSGQLPLSFRISSTTSGYDKTVIALVDIINQYSLRWSNLDLYIPEGYCFHSVDNHAVLHAPMLKSIRLFRLMNDRATKLNFQLTSPFLERASLTNIPMDGSNIQWDNLTHLTLDSMSITDTFRILRKTLRLVYCSVEGFSYCKQSIGPPVLSSMRSLQLLNYGISKGLLDNLIVPHLEEFNLLEYFTPTKIFVTSFLRRCASLRSLSIGFRIPQSPEDFMNFLQSMPSLTTLSLMSITTRELCQVKEYHPRDLLALVGKVLSSQSSSLQQQGFLPNLKILEYTGMLNLHSGNYDDLYPLPPADNVHGPLHLFKLDLASNPATRIPKSMISYISSLAERGVTVKVVSGLEDILQSSIDYHRCKEDFDWSDNLGLESLFS